MISMPSNDVLSDQITRLWGTPGPEVNGWAIGRLVHGKWERLKRPDGTGAMVREFPIEELTTENVIEQWGYGTYRVTWFSFDPHNDDSKLRRKACGSGPVVELTPPEATSTHAAARTADPPAAHMPALPGLSEAMALLSWADQRSSNSLQSILSTAQALGGQNNNTALFEMMMRQQSEMAQLQIATIKSQSDATIAALRADVDRMRAEMSSDDDDEEGGALGSVAKAAAGAVGRGGKVNLTDGLKQAAISWVTENPGELVAILKNIPSVLKAVSEAGQPQAAPAPPAAVQHPNPPRVVVVKKPAPPHQPGLNAILAAHAKEEEAAAAKVPANGKAEHAAE